MVQKGVFYTLRNKLGLGIGKIIVHGFDLSSKKTVCEIKVPALMITISVIIMKRLTPITKVIALVEL